jgi:translation initiation factor IF-2
MTSKETTTQTTERAPIVVIMGHIDHGKSTLLDYIRKTNIVATEAGGITQHISAYEVSHKDASGAEKRITFLDTPGHEAFKGMRARGARVADIAVLVVSAEDGVKEQTLEAYRSIMDAEIPFIVAINKIDKPNANIEQTKLSLAEAGIYVEGYGGNISWCAISAKAGTGIPELLDTMLLLAEMEELTGDPEKPAEGVIIESRMDPKKGIIATLVITDGTIKKGMFAVADEALTPIRSIENFAGKTIDQASFSSPIRLTGWSIVPPVGSVVRSFPTKKLAEEAVIASKKQAATPTSTARSREDGMVTIPIVLKTDVAGTLEAIEHELGKIKKERIAIRIIQKGVGTIGESDIKIATGSSGALVIGFHTKADALAADLAFRNNVTIAHFDIIYKLTEWIEEIMKERAPHIEVAEETGSLRVIRFFSQQKEKQVIGGRVESGKIVNGSKFKIMRRDAEIGEGKIVELQQQKIKAKEVGEGTECGLMVESKFTIAERDILVPFVIVKKQ